MPNTLVYLNTISSDPFAAGLGEISEHLFNIKQERQIRDLFVRCLNARSANHTAVAEEPRDGSLKGDIAIYAGPLLELESYFEMKFQYPADLTPSLCSTFAGDALKSINGNTCSHFLLVTQEAQLSERGANMPNVVVAPLNYQRNPVTFVHADQSLRPYFNCVHHFATRPMESRFLLTRYHFRMYHNTNAENDCACSGWVSARLTNH